MFFSNLSYKGFYCLKSEQLVLGSLILYNNS